ncbi:MAG: alpha/beta hydrolase [Gammaproteobacteria bacterium]|nr:alpha/beta hydrolase [Gammaproteobacteria bacterium]
MPDSSNDRPRSGRQEGEEDWQLAVDGGSTLRGFRRHGEERRAGVFIHGFRSHCDGEKARYLSARAGMREWGWLRFDQRGCGRSTGEFRRFTVSGAIDDLLRVLDALDAPSYILVGSSLGALVAVHAARAGRHRIDGLVLIAPALRFTDRLIHDQLDGRALAAWRRRGYRWFPDLYAGGCYRLDHAFCADALRYGEPPGKLPCPVHVIHGSRDELLPLRDTENWLAGLDCPAAGLEIVDGGDHRLNAWSDVITRYTEILWNETRKSCA